MSEFTYRTLCLLVVIVVAAVLSGYCTYRFMMAAIVSEVRRRIATKDAGFKMLYLGMVRDLFPEAFEKK